MSAQPTPIRKNLPKPEFSDAALIASIRRGDGSVARVLHDRIRPAIEHALRRVLRYRSEDFDDLVQVTFERVIRGIVDDRFAGDSALTTWAAAIAGHVAIDYLRRSVRERKIFCDPIDTLPEPASERPQAERRLEARSEILRLYSILGKMKPKLVETVVLCDVLGHSLEEVASLTGVTPSAAQSRLFRGRKELVRRAGLKQRRHP